MTASQSREMTLNNENNNQPTVNQTLGARLKTVNLLKITEEYTYGFLQTPVLMKYTGYLVLRTSTTGEQVLKYCVNTLLCKPNKKTRAQQSIANKKQVDNDAPQFPWSGRYGSKLFWLSKRSLKKNFDFATNTA
jgi:hypothetical protein